MDTDRMCQLIIVNVNIKLLNYFIYHRYIDI
jgi:hypothetical protein